jgi:hypothetical protein
LLQKLVLNKTHESEERYRVFVLFRRDYTELRCNIVSFTSTQTRSLTVAFHFELQYLIYNYLVKDEVGMECGTYGREMHTKFTKENLKQGDHQE